MASGASRCRSDAVRTPASETAYTNVLPAWSVARTLRRTHGRYHHVQSPLPCCTYTSPSESEPSGEMPAAASTENMRTSLTKLVHHGVPGAAWIQSLNVSRFGFLLIINLLFLVLGCFLDTLLMLLVIVPIAMPTITALGIDKVHFGVTTIVNLMIGMVTPPYSELLFVVTGITGISLTSMYKYIWRFIIALLIALLIMLAVPDLVLWLPIQLGYTPDTPA